VGASHPVPYLARWDSVPIVVLDFETTGIRPGIDRAVEAGLARFEGGKLVRQLGSLLDPQMPIPAEASGIHGIGDADVAGKPLVTEFFARDDVAELLQGAQPAAYNAGFDHWFVPPWALADWTWPWLDALTLVRAVDRYARGDGRHRLSAACARHGVALANAHRADDDARAAGELFFKLMAGDLWPEPPCLGDLLGWMRQQDALQWSDFNGWLARQPQREAVTP
jgi:DNA polymerase III subunit epsilon